MWIHRLPNRRGDDNTPRPMIVRFLRFSDREEIWRRAFKLKGTQYRIYEDFPRDIIAARKAQLPTLKQARKDRKKASFSSTFPDRLFIDGKYLSYNGSST